MEKKLFICYHQLIHLLETCLKEKLKKKKNPKTKIYKKNIFIYLKVKMDFAL